ncbi:MAG: sulfatase-like hydrolase/transferase [Verrucomicrobiales bacterium]
MFKGQDYAPDRINEQALEFVRANKDEPFFLYYPSLIPHVALHVPDEDLEPYHSQNWEDPPFTRDSGYGYTPHFTPRAAYAAMITRLDTYVGHVLDLLDELDLAENTIVIFTSDNGTTHLKAEVELYDLENAPSEFRDVAAENPEVVSRIESLMESEHVPSEVFPIPRLDRLSAK